jgi:hypothetical protein
LKDDEIVKKHKLAVPGSGGGSKEGAVIFKWASKFKDPEASYFSL